MLWLFFVWKFSESEKIFFLLKTKKNRNNPSLYSKIGVCDGKKYLKIKTEKEVWINSFDLASKNCTKFTKIKSPYKGCQYAIINNKMCTNRRVKNWFSCVVGKDNFNQHTRLVRRHNLKILLDPVFHIKGRKIGLKCSKCLSLFWEFK